MLSLSCKKQDYYYKSPSGTRLFQLSLGPVILGLMRQQDQTVKTTKGNTVRWNDYCRYLLDLKKNRGVQKGFMEEILDIQGIRYKNYLEGTNVDERAEQKEAV